MATQIIEMYEFLTQLRVDNWLTTAETWRVFKPINYFPTEEYVSPQADSAGTLVVNMMITLVMWPCTCLQRVQSLGS